MARIWSLVWLAAAVARTYEAIEVILQMGGE